MQKINDIEIKNFKSIRQTEIKDCRKVNVFVGPPNVGKSNILEALSLLTFIRPKRPVGLEKIVRFKRFSQLFNGSNIKSNIEIIFNAFYSLYLSYADEDDIDMRLRDHRNDSPFSVANYSSIAVGKHSIHFSGPTNGEDDFSGFHSELKDFNVKPYKFDVGASFHERYSAIELQIPNGNNLSEIVIHNKELFVYFSNLIAKDNRKLYNDNYELKFELISDDGIPSLYPLSLLADTLLRLIFFKAAIQANYNSILLFEEPEAHCYEPYIMEITNAIKNDENNNQYFIVTHSQYVIDELLRDEEYRKNVNIYLVGLDNHFATKVKLLNPKVSEDVYQSGLNVFFNFKNLWDEN